MQAKLARYRECRAGWRSGIKGNSGPLATGADSREAIRPGVLDSYTRANLVSFQAQSGPGNPRPDGVVNLGSFKRYVGRFAPSPTGPLHAGSLVAALASWLDARAWNGGVGGRWLVRVEDLDTQRCARGATAEILRQLQDCGLLPDEPPVFQSQRVSLYRRALEQLMVTARVYACGCSRNDIDSELAGLGRIRPRHGERVYPGTCRQGLRGKPALAWRFLVEPPHAMPVAAQAVYWTDRRLSLQQQQVSTEVGDFVVLRADGPFAYQLAVVVDDAAQHVSHVVRGEDLCDNTARQILLQRALDLPLPQYLHTPLVLVASGEKLSKQNGAKALDTRVPLHALNAAAGVLGLPPQAGSTGDALAAWIGAWRGIYNPLL